MADDMESYGNGYDVIFAEAPPSSTVILTSQSWKLKLLGKALARVAGSNGGN
jgi:hypothetical protein